jgi:hypothetical protein
MRNAVFALFAGLAGGAGCQSLDVISFTTTANTVTGGMPLATETDAVTFVAVETEVNGTDNDIDGAALTDDSGATYGALQAMAPGGPYVLALTFEQINQVSPIDFTVPGGERAFIAQFHDDDSDEVTRTINLDLTCRTATGLSGACNGACTDIQVDTLNCGRCGQICGAGQSCVDGACTAGG